MITVKANTKRGQKLIERAQCWDGDTLDNIYGTYSPAKAQAYGRCYDMCAAMGGEVFSIVSHNSFGFSVSWIADDGVHLVTPKYHYLIAW